jgi:hypothetical protein
VKWTTQRKEMFQCPNEKGGNLSFHLGGKAASDGHKWTPNMNAVLATVMFTIATGRLEQTWLKLHYPDTIQSITPTNNP